jgi:hypothetical protein
MEFPPAPPAWDDSDDENNQKEEDDVDLDLRRKEEKKAVAKFDTLKLKRRQCWFLVDVVWLQKWYRLTLPPACAR